MIGNYLRDPDRFDFIEEWLRGFMRIVDQASPEARELAALQESEQQLSAKMEELRRAYLPAYFRAQRPHLRQVPGRRRRHVIDHPSRRRFGEARGMSDRARVDRDP